MNPLLVLFCASIQKLEVPKTRLKTELPLEPGTLCEAKLHGVLLVPLQRQLASLRGSGPRDMGRQQK